ncbi:MAG: hypothetical protein FWD13_13545, partial [Treponema sp.]|nr:hypothetical protein [Treponema sp.]
RDKILNNYGELFGTGALKDILSSDVSSEDFCLDEYQIAIIRAKALVLYWERKTEINKAILAYAGELSAGRMTEAEGIRAWEDAKAAYNFSLSVYENELNKLNDIGIDFQKQQAVLNSLTLQMQKEEENLKLLNSEYASFISLSINSRENYYLSEFNTRYNYLVNEYKYNLLKGDDSSYRNILLYGMLWDIAEQKEMIENILHLLETRDDLSEEEIAALNNEYLLLNPEKQKEIWQNTCNSLAALFNSYGFESGTYLLPDVQRISEAILGKPGDFVQNTVNFLMDFDECFYIIPQWLDYEIENWKDAIIEYIAAYSFSTGKIPVKSIAELSTLYEQYLLEYTVLYQFASMLDYTDIIEAELMNSELKDKINKLIMLDYMYKITESWEIINFYSAIGNEKHWRQYLSDEYIINKDFSLAMSLTWTEGIIADALYYASYYTNRVNDSLDLISQKDQYIRNENSGHFFNLYYKELSKNIMAFNSLRILSNEIPNFVKAYELSRMSPEETKNQLLFLEESLKTQENKFNLLWENYHLEAEKFMDIGSLYDSQYTILKKAHDNADEKRFLYEKQDAIQRWASTPYIHADSVDLENSNVKLQRAQTVLNVLSDLYNSENTRSHDNPEYQILYSAYEESFNRKLKALEAIELISSEYMYELNNNEKLFMEYQNSLNRLGYIDSSLVNLITEKNGRLVFIKNESNPNGIEELFTTTSLPEGERFNITQYDDALRGLSQRMSGYFTDRSKFQQWSYARNHLLLTLMRSGSDYSFLNKYYSAQGQMAEGGSVASILIMTERKGKKDTIYSEIGGRSLFVDAEILFKNEWDRLSAEEKADLEFYVILTLTTGNDYFSGFSMYYTHDVYMHALN